MQTLKMQIFADKCFSKSMTGNKIIPLNKLVDTNDMNHILKSKKQTLIQTKDLVYYLTALSFKSNTLLKTISHIP